MRETGTRASPTHIENVRILDQEPLFHGMVASSRSRSVIWRVVRLATVALLAGCAVGSVRQRADQGPRTITTLAWSPRAFLFHGFATREECEHVRELARPRMRRSTVVGGDEEYAVSSVRTSFGTFLSRFQDGTLAALEERIALWTHLNVTHQEDPQVLRYAPGQEYLAHMDDLEEEVPRVATVILYLSDVESGGETVFPLRNISVAPKMGDALLFWSLDARMEEDQYALHAGAPVLRGVKVRVYVAVTAHWRCTDAARFSMRPPAVDDDGVDSFWTVPSRDIGGAVGGAGVSSGLRGLSPQLS